VESHLALQISDAAKDLLRRRIKDADENSRVGEAWGPEGLKVGVLIRRHEESLPGHLFDKTARGTLNDIKE